MGLKVTHCFVYKLKDVDNPARFEQNELKYLWPTTNLLLMMTDFIQMMNEPPSARS